MTLYELIEIVEKDVTPILYEGDDIVCYNPGCIKLTICLTDEEDFWVTCEISNPILIPWYDSEVMSIYPKEHALEVWIDGVKYLQNKFTSLYFCERSKLSTFNDIDPIREEAKDGT